MTAGKWLQQNPKLVIKKSPIRGKGVFANRDFAPNSEVLNWKNKNLSRVTYLNHSCSANCYTVEPHRHGFGQDVLMAGQKGVKKGEEITFDYRKTRWRELWRTTIKNDCGCGHCLTKRPKSS